MKKLSFLALAAAGMLMVGCADKDIAVEEAQVVQDEESKQFIALNINMPVDNSTVTRNATETNDNNYNNNSDDADHFELNDGMESEYTVNDATLVVFHPAEGEEATEYDAAFVAAYDINPEPWKPSSDNQVTDYSTKIVQKVGTTVKEGDLALVILNKNGLFNITEDGKFQVYGENGLADFSGTFKELQEALATNSTGGKTAATAMTNNGFYMSNSPLTTDPGSTSANPTQNEGNKGNKIRTLVPIKNVYETEQAARDGECAEIYVERGMAKVTLSSTIANPKLTTKYGDGIEGVTAADLNLTIDAWVLDHTNATSFMVRSTEDHESFITLLNPDANKYRYIGKSDITEGNPEDYKYRTYFAKDPNYEVTPLPSVFGQVMSGLTYLTPSTLGAVDASGKPTVMSDKFGDTNPQYCFENTFDVAHQSIDNTTLVRLKVTAKTGANAEDLYIINGNKSVIYKEADVKTLIGNKCVELVKAAGVETINAQTKIEASDFTITFGDADVDGYKGISGISFNITAKVTEATQSLIPNATDLLSAVKSLYKDNTPKASGGTNKNGSILCYAGGVSYYTIRIKHFGDQLTPWKIANSAITVAPSLAIGSYPGWDGKNNQTTADAANNYLGRYGVLRNNWYDIKIKDIKYLGEAVPVNYSNDPTPDDEIEGYIAVQINILSWAKRTQQWSL